MRGGATQERCEKKMKNISIKAMSKIAAGKSYVNTLAARAKRDLASDKKGQGILEYGVLFIVVGLGMLAAVSFLKNTMSNKLDEASASLSKVNPNI